MDDPSLALKLALVAPPNWIPLPWQSRLLGRLMRDPRFVVTARIGGVESAPPLRPKPLTRAVLSLEDRLLRNRQDRGSDPAALTTIATLPYRPSAFDPGPRFDLALSLTDRWLPEAELRAAPRGEWLLSFGGLPPGTSPTLAGLLPAKAEGLVSIDILQRSWLLPEPRRIRRAQYNPKPLAKMTGDFLAEKALLLLEAQLRTLARVGEPIETFNGTQTDPELPRSALSYCASAVRATTVHALHRLKERSGRGSRYWHLGSAQGGIEALAPERLLPLPRHHHTMADPFLFEWGGALYLFYEAVGPDSGPGWIEVALVEPNGMKRLGTALKSPTHLSYPFVFSAGGDVFMMPETQQNRRLEVWRATEFPLRWELYATALEGLYPAESSLFQHHGQWWLFTNLSDHSLYQDHSSELYLFAVDGPKLRQIEPHPMNPVVIGSDMARNAGAVIADGGRLFRPSQLNAHGLYGYGLNLMQIDQLDRNTYAEHLYRRFTPAGVPGASGMHHLSIGAGRHVIDLCQR